VVTLSNSKLFTARCKTLDTSPKFLNSVSLCTNNHLRKEAGTNDASPPPTLVYVMQWSAPHPNRVYDDTELRQVRLFVQCEAESRNFEEVSRVLHRAVITHTDY
jgi:hypothetical protein